MTSVENSVSEPPNLKIFWWTIPQTPLQGSCLQHSRCCPPPPPPLQKKNLATVLLALINLSVSNHPLRYLARKSVIRVNHIPPGSDKNIGRDKILFPGKAPSHVICCLL